MLPIRQKTFFPMSKTVWFIFENFTTFSIVAIDARFRAKKSVPRHTVIHTVSRDEHKKSHFGGFGTYLNAFGPPSGGSGGVFGVGQRVQPGFLGCNRENEVCTDFGVRGGLRRNFSEISGPRGPGLKRLPRVLLGIKHVVPTT